MVFYDVLCRRLTTNGDSAMTTASPQIARHEAGFCCCFCDTLFRAFWWTLLGSPCHEFRIHIVLPFIPVRAFSYFNKHRSYLCLFYIFSSGIILQKIIWTLSYHTMPKQITDIRDFLQKARRSDAKLVKIRKRDTQTKFKIRCSRHLYTLVVTDSEKADKLTQSLPPGLQRKTI